MMTYCRVLLLLLLVTTCISSINSNALLGVDLGSEWIRVSLVKPGIPMEIVINKESNRRTPLAVLLLDDERLIGESAITTGMRKPHKLYRYLTRILGCSSSNPLIRTYQQQFPYLELRHTEEENQSPLVFQSGYSPEEVLGMMLNYTRASCEEFANFYPTKDVVLTVPPYYTQSQRRALLRAAELGEVNVLQLLNSNAAVALHFGVFQTSLYADKPIKVLFFDMGATSTIATVVSYELVNLVPTITLMGTGYNRELGGFNIDFLLYNKIASQFESEQASKGYRLSVDASPKAIVKLLREISRVKKVLSANIQHYAQIESFLNDIDLKILVQRSELEQLGNETIFNKIPGIIYEALEAAGGLTPVEIDYVVPIGSSSRVPKVKEILLQTMKISELTQTINAEESHATGASYQAATLSKTFKVKPVKLLDCNVFPIEISYHKQIPTPPVDNTEDSTNSTSNTTDELNQPEMLYTRKIVRKRLFHRSNVLPQKKLMTFKNFTYDLILNASYILSEKWLTDYERDVLSQGSYSRDNTSVFTIARIEVSGVKEAIYSNTDSEFKSLRVHFSMDENNLFNITGADAVFERKSLSVEKSTFEGISDTIREFFSSEPSDTTKDTIHISPTKNYSGPDNSSLRGNNTGQSELQNNKTLLSLATPTSSTFYYDLPVSVVLLDYDDPNKETKWTSNQRLKSLANRDEEKKLLERVMNNLESGLYDTKEMLHQFETMQVTNSQQQEEILHFISETSEWFFNQQADTPKEEYMEKFSALHLLTKDVYMRVRESKELPIAIHQLMDSLNASKLFLDNMLLYPNLTQMVFTDSDSLLLSSKYNDTVEWLEAASKEQSLLQPHENPTLTVSLVQTKQQMLEREVRYLMGKLSNLQQRAKKEEYLKRNQSKTAKKETSLDIEDPTIANQSSSQNTTEPPYLDKTVVMSNVSTDYDNSNINADTTPTTSINIDDTTTSSSNIDGDTISDFSKSVNSKTNIDDTGSITESVSTVLNKSRNSDTIVDATNVSDNSKHDDNSKKSPHIEL